MRRNNIPDGWLLKKLNQISTFESGGTPSKGVDEFWVNGDIKWLSAKYIDQDKIIGCDYITKQGLDNSSAKITNFGDIILVTRVSVGKIVFVEEEFAVNQDLTIIKTDDTNKKFLFYVLKNKTKDIIDKSQGLAIKGITKEELSNIKVLVPPLPEQKKIAEILGTWDRAIEELTGLIAEKKELKRGLMQRLLTGTQRLPGGTKPWKKIKLHDVAEISKGTQLNRLNMLEEGFPVYNGGMTESGFTNEYNNDAYTIIISEGGNSCGFVNFIKTKFWAGGHCYTVICHDCVNKSFLYQLLKYNENKLMNLRVGSGLPNIQQKALNKFSLLLPDDFTEQKAIADVLSKADSEIDLLNQQLNVLREQKRGLMQKLLTGEIRVKVDME